MTTITAQRLDRIHSFFASKEIISILPEKTLDWIHKARPLVAGKPRDFGLEPFWLDVYQDDHPNIMLVNGRQTFKTTFCTDILAWYATTHRNVEVAYVADNETHLSAFSKQRLRRETFKTNPSLRQFLVNDRANIGEIALQNNSIIYLLTDENEYNKVESRSLSILMLDEAQYQDVQFLPKAMYALSQTRGRFYVLGVGGEAGSEYYKLWKRTDQRVWVYDNKNWREMLKFDNNGNVINDNLSEVLSGRWIAQKPENKDFRGYHMPQTIFARIPLTIEDAKLKYKIGPTFSIEWQEKHAPKSIFISHVMGEFYKADRRPITPEMVYACMEPYSAYALLRAEEVRELKATFESQIRVLMGVDFGSGPAASSTVISIMLYWRKSNRYHLAWIEKRPQEHQLDQARYIANLGHHYGIEAAVGDLGYGQIQVKVIQDGGSDSHDNKFEGLGRRRFMGCRTIGDETKPDMEYKTVIDEHGEKVGRKEIDKTTWIQNFIDFVGTYVNYIQLGKNVSDDNNKRTKLMIPYANDYDVDFLINDFCSITRKDMEKVADVVVDDPRQNAKKMFNHPPDSVMSIIYCLVANENFDEDPYGIIGVKKQW